MDEIQMVDTTLRDGDISLWAYGMTTGMMLPALRRRKLNQVHIRKGDFSLTIQRSGANKQRLQ